MYWEYRIREGKKTIGIYEVYFNDNGLPVARSKKPISLKIYKEEGTEEETPYGILCKKLELILRDIKTKPVFEDPEEWAEAKHEN